MPELKRSTYQARRRYQGARTQQRGNTRSCGTGNSGKSTNGRLQKPKSDVDRSSSQKKATNNPGASHTERSQGNSVERKPQKLCGRHKGTPPTGERPRRRCCPPPLPDEQEESDTPEQREIRRSSTNPPNVEDTPEFRFEELSGAVKRLKKGKSPGPDLFEAETIQRLGEEYTKNS